MKLFLRGSFIVVFILCISQLIRAQAPVANFSANVTTSCAPAVIAFTDLSTGSPTSWNWDLGNGTNATIQHPTTAYITPGNYTVVLTVSNASGSNTKTMVNYITITPTPAVAFTSIDTSTSCVPKTVHFINQTVPNSGTGTVTYSWDFGDGATSSLANPTHIYTSPGIYNVTLVTVNGAGCTSVLTKNAYINAAPKAAASFTTTNSISCTAPITVNFTNTSTGAGSYIWDFGDGNTSTATSPSHTYTTTGAFTVKLIAVSPAGCHDTIIKPALVNIGNLTSGFSMSTGATCINTPVSFTNMTTPASIGTVRWYFGDGNTSTQSNPTHSYTTPGTYTVKLVATFNNCADSTTRTIVIAPKPQLQFSAANNVGCSVPLTVNFSNTSTGATSFLWIFGDGSTSTATNPSHTYITPGQFTVKLIGNNATGCADTLIMTDYVKVSPLSGYLANLPNQAGCAPATISPTATVTSISPIISYSWDFGDGTTGSGISPIHTYTAPGNYTITMTATTVAGCGTTLTAGVMVGSHANPSFTATPTNICAGQVVSFSNTTVNPPTGVNYQWYFGDGGTSGGMNATHPYNNIGVFTPMLVSITNGCRDTFRIPNLITVTPPLAEFSYAVSCSDHRSVTFINNSVGALSWAWDFGDGTTYNGPNPPVHAYTATGTYTVSLTVTNGTCTHTKTETIKIFDLQAAFTTTTTPVCNGTPIFFDAVENPNIISYTWDFGDGNTITRTDDVFLKLYAQTGIYTPTLIVKDIYNCTDSLKKPNHVKINGINAVFAANNTHSCGLATITFVDQSTTTVTPIVTRIWDFGDSTSLTTTATTITHTYTASGVYNVRLRLIDSIGCQNELTKVQYITVTKPVVAFTTADTNICLGKPVIFANTTTGSAPVTYSWDFGDGFTSTAVNPTHQYTSIGTYTVRLIATDAFGCKDTLTRINYIRTSTLSAGFIPSDTLGACPPLTVNFTNTSTPGVSYFWNFGNGNTSTSVNPSNVFSLPGIYTVTLKVTNSAGCTDSVKKTIRVKEGPAGTFTYTPISGCFPLTVNFSSANTNTTSITFDFNNGITHTTTANSYSYTYTQPGNYLPVLVLSNGAGCNTSVVGTDTIRIAKVYAGFRATPDTICLGSAISFTDTSKSVATSINSYNWNFGDGNTATGPATTHTYTTAGTYNVRLIISGATGCKDTAYRTVVVQTVPVLSAQNKIICAGGSVALSVSGASTYSWSPATGLSCTNCANPTANPATTTTYTITGYAAGGCSSTTQVTVTVNPTPLTLNASGATICQGTSATLSASGASTYQWTPATGLSCTTCASPVANPATTTTYTLTGTSAAGCSNSINVTVNVNPKPVVTTADQQICVGGTANLSASGATSYSWSPATGLSCTNCANPVATPSATTTYTVTGTNANGCSNTAQATVSVITNPVITVSGNTSNCLGTAASLSANGAVSYTWTPATGLSCTNCANPIATPAVTTTYTVTGTISAGCSGSTTATVTVHQPPTVTAGNNVNTCSGTAVTLNAGGAATYSWSPAAGLSCTTCASPSANPATTTTYSVIGTDAFGCSDTATVTVRILPKPTITTGNQMVCAGNSVTLSASGANSYVWSPATGLSCTNCANPVATPSATTTYTVTGTDSNGCTNTGQSVVTVTTLPVITVSGNTVNCLGTGAALTASGAVTYNWSPATGLSCTNCANPVATPTTTTTYTVLGTISAGCTGTTTVTVTVKQPPTVTAGNNVSTCFGTPVTLNASGAATYSWSPATGLSCANCASPSANPAATTTYTVTGTDASGCTDTGIVTVTVLPKPTITTANQMICAGGSVGLSAAGGTSYVWSPATGLSCTSCANPVASPSTTTTYTVTGTDNNGCTNTAQSVVTVTNLPVITVSGNTVNCLGTGAALTAGGAVSYAWSPATGLSCTNCANPVATPTTTTTYTVTGTISAGCTGTTTVTVTVRQPPTVTAGNNVSTCAGTPVTITGNGASTYSWSPATGLSCTNCASPSANPTATTTYTVTGTDAFGCTDTGIVTVTVLPKPVITTSNQSMCAGGTATLTANGGTSYVWSPATGLSCTTCTNPVATPSATTTYTVTGTGTNGCTNTAQAVVTVNPIPAISVSGNPVVCPGSGAAITASGAASYVWSPATGLSCTTCTSPVATPATTTTYTVTGTSAAGCVGTTTVTVTVRTAPSVTAGNDQSTCLGTPVSLAASGATTYVWTPAAGLSCTNCPSPSANPTTTTTYIVTGTDAFGCKDTGMVTVAVKALPVIQATRDTSICKLTSVQLEATGGSNYVWSPATGLSCTNCPNPVATPGGAITYTVTGTGSNGCLNTALVTVSQYPQPAVNAGPDQTICAGRSTQLTASGASSYVWTPAATLSCSSCTNTVATPLTSTTYMVTGTDLHGCIDSDKVAVTVIQRQAINIGAGGEICEGESFKLHASGGSDYIWFPANQLNNNMIPDPIASPSATTTYYVVVKQGQCFADTLSATVVVHPLPTVNAGPDRNITGGSSTQLEPTGTNISTYLWTPADGLSCTTCATPIASPKKTTTYTVDVTSEFGCKAQDDVTLFVTCEGNQVWLPNTFTPNADGHNDRFYPHGRGINTVLRFRIYDRWGEVLYDRTNVPTDDDSYGWDGTYKNQQLKPDVYVYVIQAQCSNGDTVELKGDISLVR